MSMDLTKLSKVISHALRHEPLNYGLTLDSQGWVCLSELLSSLREKGFPDLKKEEVEAMIEKSEKKRHEISGEHIRAYYGHSLDEKIMKQKTEPPEFLYHGTVTESIESIRKEGLLPMARQYVHLSIDIETAKLVGSRKKGQLVIIIVKAKAANNKGINFYREGNGIWLSDPIPSEYLNYNIPEGV